MLLVEVQYKRHRAKGEELFPKPRSNILSIFLEYSMNI